MIGLVLTLVLAQSTPRPPVFSPSQDAPHTTGQPGYVRPVERPRSPHIRVLPPMKEPGLWSGDRPKATGESGIVAPPVRRIGDPIPRVSLLGFAVPTFNVVRDGFEFMPAEQCAYANEVDLLGGDMTLYKRAFALTAMQRECLAALAQHQCLLWLKKQLDDEPSLFNADRLRGPITFSLDATIRWMQATCPRASESTEIPQILKALLHGRQTGRPTWTQ